MSKRRATLPHQAEIISCIPGPHRRADYAVVFRADSIAAYLTRSVAQRFTAIIKTEGKLHGDREQTVNRRGRKRDALVE